MQWMIGRSGERGSGISVQVAQHDDDDDMHKPESVPKNEMHNILWDFEIQPGHLIPASRQDIVLINKKTETLTVL